MSTARAASPRTHLRLVRPNERPVGRARAEARSRRTVALLLGSTAFLVGTGLVMVLSASSVSAFAEYGDSFVFVQRQAVYAVVGVLALVIASRMRIEAWRRLAVPFLLVTVAMLILVLHPAIGVSAYGSSRWFELGPVTVAALRDREARARGVLGGDPRPSVGHAGGPRAARHAAPSGVAARLRARDHAARPRDHGDPGRDDVPVAVRRRGSPAVPGVRGLRRDAGRSGSDHERELPSDPVPRVPQPVGGPAGHRVPTRAVAVRARRRGLDGGGARRVTAEVGVRPERAHGLHLLDPGGGARAHRRALRAPGVRRPDLRGDQDRDGRARRVRPAPGGGDRRRGSGCRRSSTSERSPACCPSRVFPSRSCRTAAPRSSCR